MYKKIIYYSVLILLIFNQCSESKKMSEENYVEFVINTSNWVLTEWSNDSLSVIISAEKPITLDFDELNKKLSGFAGCNQYFGNYKLENEVFSVGPIGGTMMLCAEGIMNQEMRFLGLLESGVNISMKNKFLILEDDYNQLKFKPIQK